MEHIVRFNAVLAAEPIWLDGKQLLEGVADLPANAWFTTSPQSRDQSVGGLRPPERERPYSLEADGSLNHVINRFVAFLRTDGVSNSTAKDYLFDLRKFARWLSAVGSNLLEATSEETRDYRKLCLDGPLEYRLSRSSWSRVEASLARFYGWAADEQKIVEKAPNCRFRRKGALIEQTVRMVHLDDYLLFRDLGIKGIGGEARASSATPLRDSAYVELSITTGMRQQEKTSLLLCELPPSDSRVFRGQRSTMLDVPETIAKFQKFRRVPLPRRVLSEYIEPYVREERSDLVERWRRSGGASRPDVLLGWLDSRGRFVSQSNPRTPIPLASLTIAERRRLVLLPYEGAPSELAEPAALWLNRNGDPMAPEAWASMFRRTCERLKTQFKSPIYITDHMLRHSFAVHWLNRLIKIQIGKEDLQHRPRDTESHMYKKVVGDPLRKIQHWLGHASSLTTQKYLTYVDEAVEQIELGTEMFDSILGETTIH